MASTFIAVMSPLSISSEVEPIVVFMASPFALACGSFQGCVWVVPTCGSLQGGSVSRTRPGAHRSAHDEADSMSRRCHWAKPIARRGDLADVRDLGGRGLLRGRLPGRHCCA